MPPQPPKVDNRKVISKTISSSQSTKLAKSADSTSIASTSSNISSLSASQPPPQQRKQSDGAPVIPLKFMNKPTDPETINTVIEAVRALKGNITKETRADVEYALTVLQSENM